ncbi:E3 ubiquitin-protein ligase RNF34-like [Brevipalpus obovatus]|uniref:E3 ubiquitin-protein ligase RNF34-like n=1 Tax=Brevipalpus obovatus TaxID=246614 RepID=UPI003D9F884F
MAGNFFTFHSATSGRPNYRQSPPRASTSRPTSNNNNNNSHQHSSDFEFPSFNLLAEIGQTFCRSPRLTSTLSTCKTFFQQTKPFNNTRQSNQNTNNTSASGSSSTSSSTVMVVCESCGTKFSFFKRMLKRTCTNCSMDFCSNCFSKENLVDGSNRARNTCRRCAVLNMQPLDRENLMNLKIKDLKWYLDKKRVSYKFCKEKQDLVELILGASGQRSDHSSSSNVGNMNQTPSSESLSNQDDASWVLVDDEDLSRQSPQAAFDQNPSSSHPHTSSSPLQTSDSYITEGSVDIPNENKSSNISDDSSSNDYKLFNIEDLENEEQIQELTVRQIKLLLARNFVDFKGCCEKEELLKKAIRLWREVKKAEKECDDLEESNLCKICMERPLDCVLLECGHVVTCISCGKRMSECPVCRQYVVRALRIFKS